jgi:hypothetical protein
MTYTALAVIAVIAAILIDLVIVRTRLVTRRVFWVSYAIIVTFQFITNGIFTGTRIVRYDGDAIIGSSTPLNEAPPFLGDGRIAFAPVEDLLFGFALILLTLVGWIAWGRRGVDRTPRSGPPMWRRRSER